MMADGYHIDRPVADISRNIGDGGRANLSPVYTTLNFWYSTDKIGTPTYLGSPRTKKVVRYQKSSVV
jgi:hypothetical protein